MKTAIFFLIALVVLVQPLKADIPRFDVFAIRIGLDTFYLTFESQGLLQNNDFCYYDYRGEYLMEVSSFVAQQIQIIGEKEIKAYKSLDVIDLTKVNEASPEFKDITPYDEDYLYILRDEIILSSKVIVNKYEILFAENGNTGGYIFTAELSEKDNKWISKNQIDLLWRVRGKNGMCTMYFFGKQGNVKEKDFEEYKKRIVEKEINYHTEIQDILSELFHKRVILIGFCSC